MLEKDNKTLVTWIESKFARVGRTIKIKEERSDEWDEGWKVVSTGEVADEPPDVNWAARTHKKRTGDAS